MPGELAPASETGLPVGQRHQRRPVVRPVSQVNCALTGDDLKEIWISALGAVLRWLSNRASGSLPREAWEGGSFELERIGTQPTAAVRLSAGSGGDYWAARNEAADTNIPNRSWVTEIGLARTNRELRFGTRLTCVTRGDDPPFGPSIPGLVRQLADTIRIRLKDAKLRVKRAPRLP
jgi:hypothetical protein